MEAYSADALIPSFERLTTSPSEEPTSLGARPASTSGQDTAAPGEFQPVPYKNSRRPTCKTVAPRAAGWWKTPLLDAINQTNPRPELLQRVLTAHALAPLSIKQLSVALLAASSRGLSEVVAALQLASTQMPAGGAERAPAGKRKKSSRRRAPFFFRPAYTRGEDEKANTFAAPLKRDELQYLRKKLIGKHKQQKSKELAKGRKLERCRRKGRASGAGWSQAAPFQDDQRAADGRWAMLDS